RSRWETLRSQPAKEADKEKACRAYAASFYESVTLRQAAVTCAAGERNLVVLDSEINAFNELLAAKCGGLTRTTGRQMATTRSADDPVSAHDHLDVVPNPRRITESGFRTGPSTPATLSSLGCPPN